MSLFSRVFATKASSPVPVKRDIPGVSWAVVSEDGAVRLTDNALATYAYIYESQPWVQVCVNKLVRGMARLPLKGFELAANGEDREQVRQGSLYTILREPIARVSPFYWKSAILGNIALYGNCICIKIQDTPESEVQEIWPVSPIDWSYDGSKDEYVYKRGMSDEVRFPSWRIWHPKFWSTHQAGFGISPLEPLRRTLAIEDAALRLGVSSFKNGARPAGVLTTQQELKDTVIERLRENLRQMHGGPDNAFRLAIMEQGLEWKPMSHSLQDAAVIEHRKLTREEVAAVFDLPQPAVGILDNANFASTRELHQMLYVDSYGPWITMFEESFNLAVLSGVPAYANQFVEFEFGEILRADIGARSEAYQRLISSGVRTPNECRKLENLPPSEQRGADLLHFPTNLSPEPAVAGKEPGEDDGRPPV